jgi:hypothetical protein
MIGWESRNRSPVCFPGKHQSASTADFPFNPAAAQVKEEKDVLQRFLQILSCGKQPFFSGEFSHPSSVGVTIPKKWWIKGQGLVAAFKHHLPFDER